MSKPDAIGPVTGSKKVAFTCYGFPGVGKTRLAGTSGEKTLILRPPTDHTDSIITPGVQEWVLHDHSELDDAYEYLRAEDEGVWDWVWFDSISLWQDTGLDDIWANVIAAKPERKKYGIDKGEYGVNMHRLGLFLRHMVGLQAFNFGVIAHPTEESDPLMPYVQGKNMSNKLCGYMNLVGYYELTAKGQRVMRFNATDDYYAKDQFDAFPKGYLLNPDMPKIVAAIDAARKQKTATTPAKTTRRRSTRRPTK